MGNWQVALVFCASTAILWQLYRQWRFRSLPRQSAAQFVQQARAAGVQLSEEELLRYRRSIARAMGVPTRCVRAEAELEDYVPMSLDGLVAQPYDLADDVAASMRRLGRAGEPPPATMAEIIRLFAADDAVAKRH